MEKVGVEDRAQDGILIIMFCAILVSITDYKQIINGQLLDINYFMILSNLNKNVFRRHRYYYNNRDNNFMVLIYLPFIKNI